MQIQRIAISAAVAAALAALPLSAAQAQYYPPCSPFPLFWPFCIAGAVVGTAAAVVTTPFRYAAGPPYYGYYPAQPVYQPSPAYQSYPGYQAYPGYAPQPYYYGR